MGGVRPEPAASASRERRQTQRDPARGIGGARERGPRGPRLARSSAVTESVLFMTIWKRTLYLERNWIICRSDTLMPWRESTTTITRCGGLGKGGAAELRGGQAARGRRRRGLSRRALRARRRGEVCLQGGPAADEV